MTDDLARYYDWLLRYERAAAWLGRGSGQRTFTLHRLLVPDRPGVSPADVVHQRIVEALGPARPTRAIDAGCGVGGTIFYLYAHLGGEYDGVTVSATQRARAQREAPSRGLDGRCRFHVRSYDEDLSDLAPGGADLITAIESLAHSSDPARTVRNLAKALAPGGRLVIVDDMPSEALPREDADFAGFREGWRCPVVVRGRDLYRMIADAGLTLERDEDLTPLVAQRDPRRLDRLMRLNRRLRAVLRWRSAATVLDSLWGGLLLERLYQRGAMSYRFLLAQRAK